MRLFRHTTGLPPEARGAVVVLGNFDGVHRGHRALIAKAHAVAETTGAAIGVVTFEPHPRQVFRPDDPPFRLTPMHIKTRLLAEAGVDLLFVLTFDADFAAQSADTFVDDILAGGLGISHAIAGHDFRFGKGRAGDADFLTAAGARHGFGVTIVDPQAHETGTVFSASEVRRSLEAGDPLRAAEILGRPWEIEGRVVKGDQRGRTLGYPTANIDMADFLRPAYGVYAIRAAVDQAEAARAGGAPLAWINGVANLGIRPMWRTDRPMLEAHLFDFSGDLYGKHLRVQMVGFLRGEMRFDGVDPLIEQMNRDSANARAILANA